MSAKTNFLNFKRRIIHISPKGVYYSQDDKGVKHYKPTAAYRVLSNGTVRTTSYANYHNTPNAIRSKKHQKPKTPPPKAKTPSPPKAKSPSSNGVSKKTIWKDTKKRQIYYSSKTNAYYAFNDNGKKIYNPIAKYRILPDGSVRGVIDANFKNIPSGLGGHAYTPPKPQPPPPSAMPQPPPPSAMPHWKSQFLKYKNIYKLAHFHKNIDTKNKTKSYIVKRLLLKYHPDKPGGNVNVAKVLTQLKN